MEHLERPVQTFVAAVVGIDGCGKSSTFRGALEALAPHFDVVGIGDQVLAGGPGDALHAQRDLPGAGAVGAIGRRAKQTRWRPLYTSLKSLDLIGRARMRDHVVEHRSPAVLLTDGDPLVNTISWSAAHLYRRQLAGDDEHLLQALHYLAGERRIPLSELPYYLRAAWPLAVVNRLHLARFRFPDLVVLLQIDASLAMQRIRARGRSLQGHETASFLAELAAGYERVCGIIEERCGVPVMRIAVEHVDAAETVRRVADEIRARTATREIDLVPRPFDRSIDVVVTTISGSLRDQRKVGRIGPVFRARTARPVRVHVVRSHAQARTITNRIVRGGGRLLVSAGGAGTFNAVLEGCHVDGSVPADLRLAFLRKGSADLVGKMLGIPDGLEEAVEAICEGIEHDRRVSADVLTLETTAGDGTETVHRLVGFGGLGVFGEVPRFTESRAVKLYKGLLGTLLGDYGPFYVGLAAATASWFVQRGLGRIPPAVLELDGEVLGPAVWVSVLIANGDLGTAFPIGRDLPFSNGSFRVVALRDIGPRRAIDQLQAARSGRILDDPAGLSGVVRDVRRLVVRPAEERRSYPVNVDGLRLVGHGPLRVGVSGSVELVAAHTYGRRQAAA